MTEREKLVELMARAQCSQGGFDPNETMPNDGQRWGYYVPGVTAALTALEAAGARLVPVEASRHMLVAAHMVESDDIELTEDEHRAIYAAFLAASPYAPLEG